MEPNATYQLLVIKDNKEQLLSVDSNISFASLCKIIREKVPSNDGLNCKMKYYSNKKLITIKDNDGSLRDFFRDNNREIIITQKDNNSISYSFPEKHIKQLKTIVKTQEQMIKEIKQTLEYKLTKEKIDKLCNEKVIAQSKDISQSNYTMQTFNFSINQKNCESKTVNQEKTNQAKGDMIMNNNILIELIKNELKNFNASQKEYDSKFNLVIDQLTQIQEKLAKHKSKENALKCDNTIGHSMQCGNCLNQLIETRYQCMSCPEYNICDDCMTLIHHCQNRNVKTIHPHFTFIEIVNLCKPINDNTTIGQSSSIGVKEIEQNKEKSISKIRSENAKSVNKDNIKEARKNNDDKASKPLEQDLVNSDGFVIVTNNSIKTKKTDEILGENQREKKLNQIEVSTEGNKKNEWENMTKDQLKCSDSKSSKKEKEKGTIDNKGSRMTPTLKINPLLNKSSKQTNYYVLPSKQRKINQL